MFRTCAVPVLCLALTLTGCGEDEDATGASNGTPRSPEVAARAAFFATVREAAQARRKGDLQEEVRLLRSALEVDPDHEGCLVDLAHALRKLKQTDEAMRLLVHLQKLRPDLARPHFLIAELLTEDADASEADLRRALELYARALEVEPNISGPRLSAARVQRRLGLLDEAEDSYRTVLGTNPDSREALVGLGMLLVERKQFEAAVPVLVRALEVGTKATGRADVPSEMDTKESFDAASIDAEPNRTAREALARAAKALGGYPETVPERFRLTGDGG